MNLEKTIANRIPAPIRKRVLDNKWLDIAVNTSENAAMLELFDIYEEFVDLTGEHDDWNCYRCRQAVLDNFKKLRQWL